MGFSYRFPVVKGVQAGQEYYIAMVPIQMIGKLFEEESDLLPPEYRAQRKLNTSRIPGIRQYVLENRDSYVFSALAVSIDGEMSFIESKDVEGTGILEVSMKARFLINDGQHRKRALIDALKEDDSLADETISVVFYRDRGLSRSQQMFTDFNKYAIKTSNSLAVLYDSRDSLAVVTRRVISQIDFLDEYTDKETDNLGSLSHCFFTLNTFYKANKYFLGQRDPEKNIDTLFEFWNGVTNNMPLWDDVKNKRIQVGVLKEQYLVTQGVIIQALGKLGSCFIDKNKSEIKTKLKELKSVNWRRSAECWRGRAVREDGRIISNNKAIVLINNELKKNIGLELTDEEMEIEKWLERSCVERI